MLFPIFIMVVDSLLISRVDSIDSTLLVKQTINLRMQETILNEKADSLIYRLENDPKLKRKLKKLRKKKWLTQPKANGFNGV